jgi:hypothetical protein
MGWIQSSSFRENGQHFGRSMQAVGMKVLLRDNFILFSAVIALFVVPAEKEAVVRAAPSSATDRPPTVGVRLSDKQVEAFAQLVLAGLDKEYPNKPQHVMTGPESKLSPRELHPAFFGCFDWHSSVHGHWMLVRLLKLYPDHAKGSEIRKRLAAHLTRESLEREADYFNTKENASFERMYGWAWCLRLAAELHGWDDPDGRRWHENIRPLETKLVELTTAYLPKLSFPIRTGVHPDTAFALGQTLDYARIVGNSKLADLVIERSRHYYLDDAKYNEAFEPSGEDFFSPALNEADLMRRVLLAKEFALWLDHFLPGLGDGSAKQLMTPVEVSDVADPRLVHLAGLNLSRAWTLAGIANELLKNDPRTERLKAAAAQHAEKGLAYVFSGHYEGEHWLATFAVYALTDVGTSR